MDPGNWATDLVGGSQFGYTPIWVLLMSNPWQFCWANFIGKAGHCAWLDLAQANRETYPKSVNFLYYTYWQKCHLQQTDLAEVLGMALGYSIAHRLTIDVGRNYNCIRHFFYCFCNTWASEKWKPLSLHWLPLLVFLLQKLFWRSHTHIRHCRRFCSKDPK